MHVVLKVLHPLQRVGHGDRCRLVHSPLPRLREIREHTYRAVSGVFFARQEKSSRAPSRMHCTTGLPMPLKFTRLGGLGRLCWVDCCRAPAPRSTPVTRVRSSASWKPSAATCCCRDSSASAICCASGSVIIVQAQGSSQCCCPRQTPSSRPRQLSTLPRHHTADSTGSAAVDWCM